MTATQGRYGDATPVNLNSSTLRLTGSNAAVIREVVGAVTVAGGSSLIPNRSLAGRTTELNVSSLTRVGQGQLAISPAVAGQLGSDERVTVAGANLAAQVVVVGGITNGMVAPWLWNSTDVQFVTFSDFGFVNAGFNMLTSGLVILPAGTGSERVQINATIQIAATTSSSFYAVRTDATIGGSNAETLSIGSGGLINANSGVSIFPATNFNGEALIATQGSVTFGAA